MAPSTVGPFQHAWRTLLGRAPGRWGGWGDGCAIAALGVVELSMDEIAEMERKAEPCAACGHDRGQHLEPTPKDSHACTATQPGSPNVEHEPVTCPCAGFVPEPESPTPVH
jgi:hypothetical protein